MIELGFKIYDKLVKRSNTLTRIFGIGWSISSMQIPRMRIINIIPIKILAYISIFFMIECFTVYTKDETILEKEKLRTRNLKEQKDVFIITHSLTSKGLYLLLDAYRVEENNQVDFIQEKYLENKAAKFNFDKGYLNCGEIHLCGAVVVIGVTVMMLEIPTLPFRLMSMPQERIRKEIQTGTSNKIGLVSTESISFVLLDRKPNKEYLFDEDKIFIPLEELELDSFTSKNFPYKLFHKKRSSILLKGNLDFSEHINADNEINLAIQENDKRKKSAQCKTEFPILRTQNLIEASANKDNMELCKSKYAESKTFIWNNPKYNECIQSIKECYSITRYSE